MSFGHIFSLVALANLLKNRNENKPHKFLTIFQMKYISVFYYVTNIRYTVGFTVVLPYHCC